MLHALTTRIVREMKASWRKTALLGLLFVVGLFFWIPPLVRMVAGGGTPRPAAGTQPATAAVQPSSPVRNSSDGGSRVSAEVKPPRLTWKDIGRILASDPLARSADASALSGTPFRIDPDQFAPPLLFAEASPPDTTPEPDTLSADADAANGPVLKSTIVGVERRAAFIDRRLYFEGSDISVGGETYRLAAVYPRKVILRRGEHSLELTIAPPELPAGVEFRPAD